MIEEIKILFEKVFQVKRNDAWNLFDEICQTLQQLLSYGIGQVVNKFG